LLERAILASDVGGTREVVEDGRSALLVPAADIEALHEGLGTLLGDPALRARLGKTAREQVVDRFDPSAAARKFTELARQLVD